MKLKNKEKKELLELRRMRLEIERRNKKRKFYEEIYPMLLLISKYGNKLEKLKVRHINLKSYEKISNKEIEEIISIYLNIIGFIGLYNCKYQKEGGVLSDFERVLGFTYPNKTVRGFLKELIDEGCLVQKDFRLVNEMSFQTYVIDRKKIFAKIKTNKRLLNKINKESTKEFEYFIGKK